VKRERDLTFDYCTFPFAACGGLAGGGPDTPGRGGAGRVYSPHLAARSVYPDGETAPAFSMGGAVVEKLGKIMTLETNNNALGNSLPLVSSGDVGENASRLWRKVANFVGFFVSLSSATFPVFLSVLRDKDAEFRRAIPQVPRGGIVCSELSATAATSLAVVVRLVAAPPFPLRFRFFSCFFFFFFFFFFFLAASSSLFSSAHFETNLSSGAPFSTHFHSVFSLRLALVLSHNNPQSVDLMDSISCPLPLSMS